MTPSITNQPIFKPKTNREVYMEDVRRMALALMLEMGKSNIQIEQKDEDEFYESLSLFLEESFNWPDYSSYN
jgi:hypothetical protein